MLASLAISLVALASPVRVMKDDGSVYEGELLEAREGDDLVMRTPSGRTVTFAWSTLRWVEYDGHKVGANTERAGEIDWPWPGRLTVAAHSGLAFFTSDTFGPYVSGGFAYGGSIGWSFRRSLALALLYEHAELGTGERNGLAKSNPSNALAVVARWRSNPASRRVGLFGHLGFGARWLSYRFDKNDGLPVPGPFGDGFVASSANEKASLFGLEARIAFGLAITLTRALSIDLYYSGSAGRFLRYSDTLDCNTFVHGSCGGGYSFTYGQHGLTAEVSWN